jgi:hypothetical protein
LHQQFYIVDHAQINVINICKMAETKTKNSRGKLWSDKETKELLEAWSDDVIQVVLENAKTLKQSNKVYNIFLVSCV